MLQLAALMLAAFRVPLAAQYPQPAEFQAIRVMLAVQFAALATLHPWLLRTWATALAILASALVLLSMAALLSSWTLTNFLSVGVFLTIWIANFALLSRIRWNQWQPVIASIAIAYVIGGPLFWYLQLEFGSPSPSRPGIAFGPMLLGLSTPRHIPPQGGVEAVAIGVVAAILCGISLRIPQNTA